MSEIMMTMARVRRAMPRNVDVMAICDELERLIREGATRSPLTRAEIQKNYRTRKKAKRG